MRWRGLLLVLLGLGLFPATGPGATPADSALARTYLREALQRCRRIIPEVPEIKRVEPGQTPPPADQLQDLTARSRLASELEIIELQWRCGDTLAAARNVEELYRWGRRQSEHLVNRFDGDVRYPMIARLGRSGALSLTRKLLREWAAEKPASVRYSHQSFITETASILAKYGALDEALELVRSGLPDSLQQRALGYVSHELGSAGKSNELWRIRNLLQDRRDGDAALNNLALRRCLAHDPAGALAAADSLPDSYPVKAYILALIGQEKLRQGDRAGARALAIRAIKLMDSRPDSTAGMGGLGDNMACGPIGELLVRLGDKTRTARFLAKTPGGCCREVLLEVAASLAAAGHTDSALAVFRQARSLRPSMSLDDDPDQGLLDWVGTLANSGLDSMAVRVAALLRCDESRSRARGLIAAAQARRGHLAAARATLGTVTQSPHGVAGALVALAEAHAAAGDIPTAVACLDEIAGAAERQCLAPVGDMPYRCFHLYPCPPVELIFKSRLEACRGIAATLAGRVHLLALIERVSPVEAVALLIGAARGAVGYPPK